MTAWTDELRDQFAGELRLGTERRVVIGYDARHGSERFADEAARVMTGAGLRVRRLPGQLPSPLVAFAVRRLGCAAGVMITASHTPPRDNGYKVFPADGAQIAPPVDGDISRANRALCPLRTVSLGDLGEPIGSSSVGRGLYELAEREHADLLFMGSCRRGLIGRLLINDDAQDTLNGVPCAVPVTPAGYARRATVTREIGVGYNGSPESRGALATARELAADRRARLSACEGVSLPAYFFTGPASPVGESIDACVEQARTRIAALGGVEPHAAYGAAAEELTVNSASLTCWSSDRAATGRSAA